MKQNIKTKSIALLLCIILIALICSTLIICNISEVTYASSTQYDQEFFSRANTYEAIITEKEVPRTNGKYKYQSISYNFNVKKENVSVSQDAPQVTFITHGLHGSAAHWSNVSEPEKWGQFEYAVNSIIELLQQKSDCNVYLADFNEKKETDNNNIDTEIDDKEFDNTVDPTIFILYKIEKENNLYKKIKINEIIDNTKHSIVIFNGCNTGQSNDYIYTQFNIMASKIVLDLQALDVNNELPRVNLIGHSRGGLTNMQYALDHPDLVDSIFSLGTPYLGSTSASVDRFILRDILNHGMSDCPGEDDIVNPEVYLGYLNRWNSGYDSLYSNIKVYAQGGYETADMLVYEVLYKYIKKYIDNDVSNTVVKILLKEINIALTEKLGILNQGLSNIAKQELISAILNITYRIFPDIKNNNTLLNGFTAALDLLFDELQYNPLTFSYDLLNDGLVDLPSQLGMDKQSSNKYKGFIRNTKRFSVFGSFNLNNSCTESLRVTHNLETRDLELLSYIVKNISMSGNNSGTPYLVVNASTENNSDGVCIVGYIGKNVEGTLTIPDKVYFRGGNTSNYQKTVVAIGDSAFANNINGENGITKIVIPDTVEVIGKSAFSNNEYLKEIIFSDNSSLTTILSGAFSFVPNLKEFTIPSNVNMIEERAFEQSGINLLESKSLAYSWQNNLLINNNVSDTSNKIAIYVNPEVNSITFPNDVGEISAYLFYGNKNINRINMNQVRNIGTSAFAFSSLTTITQTENIIETDLNNFVETPWLKSQTDKFIIVGKVLISYNGNDTNVELPEGVQRIGERAFISCETRTVVLPSTLESIGSEAFEGCENLEWVLFNAITPPILDGDCFSTNTKIYVKSMCLDSYNNSIFFKDLDNSIDAKKVKIRFFDMNGNAIGEREEEYYSTFDNFVDAPKVTGKTFLYWLDKNGKAVNTYDIFKYYEDVELTANYEPSKYIINIKGADSRDVTYGQEMDFGRPLENGRRFIGWFDNLGNRITDSSGKCVWRYDYEIDYIEPKFEVIIYTITYKSDKSEAYIDTTKLPKQFHLDSPISLENLYEPKQFGYVFKGWYINGSLFETTYGIYNNIVLTAKWEGDKLSYTTGGTYTINNRYAIVDLNRANTNNKYIFYISGSVKYITFFGSEHFSNMRIVISERNTRLVLGFQSMDFQPAKSPNSVGENAITAYGNFQLYITFSGANYIRGGEGADGISYYSSPSQATNNNKGKDGTNGGDGQNGGYGIQASNVYLAGNDDNASISICGGRGGNGGRGENGQEGSNGVNPPSGWFLHPVNGDNGSNGGNGGKGGNGGEGGYGIYVTNSLKVTAIGEFYLTGGDGGSGGNGGVGGDGGDGASDTSANPFNGVGKPGNGGNGGNGGDAGSGGAGSSATNVDNIKGTGGSGGRSGSAGDRGYGGYGGSGGSFGNNGTDGSGRGIIGNLGYDASVGIDGNDVNSTSNYIGLPYLFDEKEFDKIA